MEEDQTESSERKGLNFRIQFNENWNNPTFLFLTGFILFGIIILIFDIHYKWDLPDLLVEAHGVLLDIFFFGIIFSIYDSYKHKSENIQRWQEEIDDYRDWDEKEATYRIAGNIHRLVKANIIKLNLSSTFLIDAKLYGLKLVGADFSYANLMGAGFVKSNLNGAIFHFSNLRKITWHHADLTNAILDNAIVDEFTYGSKEEKEYLFASFFNKLSYSQVVGIEELEKKYTVYRYVLSTTVQFRIVTKAEYQRLITPPIITLRK